MILYVDSNLYTAKIITEKKMQDIIDEFSTRKYHHSYTVYDKEEFNNLLSKQNSRYIYFNAFITGFSNAIHAKIYLAEQKIKFEEKVMKNLHLYSEAEFTDKYYADCIKKTKKYLEKTSLKYPEYFL